MNSRYSTPETLEQRIAPAALATFSFQDVNGKTVTVTASKGTAAQLQSVLHFDESGHLLQLIDLTSNPVYKGTDLSVSVAGADVADVGVIDATGFDLGTVTVDGDVARLTLGDTNLLTPAVKSLHVGSLGAKADSLPHRPLSLSQNPPQMFWDSPQPLPVLEPVFAVDLLHDFLSSIKGPVISLEIDHDLVGTLEITGNTLSKITTAKIHGSLSGGSTENAGSLLVAGGIDTLVVDHDLQGGGGERSGSVFAAGVIRSATISGSILGGVGDGSGTLVTPLDILSLKVSHDIIGAGDWEALGESGVVRARNLTTATVDGKIQGGYYDHSGSIVISSTSALYGVIGNITVTGGLFGGHGEESGVISSSGVTTKATVGSATAGLLGGEGKLSGSVLGYKLGTVEVFGNVEGDEGELSGSISAVSSVTKITIHGKLQGALGPKSGTVGSNGSITEIVIEGGLFGGSGPSAGYVATVGGIGKVTIKNGITGGDGEFSGTVGSLGLIGTVNITGDLTGGSVDHSGALLGAGTISSITITGSLVGKDGDNSGRIEAKSLPSVTITGNVESGLGSDSGTVYASGTIGKVDVKGSLVGYLLIPESLDAGGGSIYSEGTINSVHVGGNLLGGLTNYSGSIGAGGTMTTVTVDGALLGNQGYLSGSIYTEPESSTPAALTANLTTVVVGKYLQGDGPFSGSILSAGKIGTLTVGVAMPAPAPLAPMFSTIGVGDVIGGEGPLSGSIVGANGLGTVTLLGSLKGVDDESGTIISGGSITKLVIKGSVRGAGEYEESPFAPPGQIVSGSSIGSLEIDGDLVGGAGDFSGAISARSLGTVLIKGNIYADAGLASASINAFQGDLTTLTVNGSIQTLAVESPMFIQAQHNIGSVTVGSFQGGLSPIVIGAIGQLNPKTAAAAVAIGSVKTPGSMINTKIIAGAYYAGPDSFLVNPSASIGTVEVGTAGSSAPVFIDSDIVAGFLPGSDSFYGTKDDNQDLRSAKPFSTIAHVIIHGTVASSADPHGIVANNVQSVIVNDVPVKLIAGANNDSLIAVSPLASTYVNEIASTVVGPP